MSNGSRYDKRKEKDNMTKKQRALIVIERLREDYPDADCTLEYEEAWSQRAVSGTVYGCEGQSDRS